MPADWNNPFGESCCDGGCMTTGPNQDPKKSAQPCGCDEAADWVCDRHKRMCNCYPWEGVHAIDCPLCEREHK